MKKAFLVIGLGKFGACLAEQLSAVGHEVMAVDSNEDKVNKVLPFATNALIGNSTDEAFLRSLGVEYYDVCYVSIGSDFQSSLETTSLLKELGAKKVVSRAEQDVQTKFLLRNGADAVVYPEEQMARWAAIRYSSEYLLDYIEVNSNNVILEVRVPERWRGRSLAQIDMRRKFDINVLAVKEGDMIDVTFSPDEALTEDMTLLVIGEYKKLRKCFPFI